MKNLVGLWVNLSRAYEIALLGKFSIKIVFDKEYIQGFDDYESIKSFYKDVLFCKDGDMTVSIHKPDYTQNRINYETLEDILVRVNSAKGNSLPTDFKSDACNTLLKTATDRLGFSHSKKEKVIEIAKIIAQLDNSKLIDVQHVAEAIQYNYEEDTFCVAEDKTISFGYGITITKSEIHSEDVNNAINYLKSLL
jgi:hypothetical protein